MAAEVEGEGLGRARSPPPHHLPQLSQFCDGSVVHTAGSDGPVVAVFLEPVVLQENDSSNPVSFLSFWRHFSLFYFPFLKQHLKKTKTSTPPNEDTVPKHLAKFPRTLGKAFGFRKRTGFF